MQTVPLLTEDIARICHEANRAYCLAQDDTSQLPWEDAPEWQRESARKGVLAIQSGKITKPEDSHLSWLQEKQAQGWVYGEKKDPELKHHPCIVPYHQLPAAQRMKDHLFFAIVRALGGLV